MLPTVYVLACGGTIAGKAASDDELTNYSAGQADISELLQAVPAVSRYAQVRGEQFCNIDSSDMREALWLRLSQRVQELADRPDIDGIVITHGTDTLEETAYFLHLSVHTDVPVVLVGSMRPATAISADGPLNLLEAVQTAACPDTGRYGVVVVMNSTINSARFVEKTDATHVDTFRSRQFGCLGFVQHGRPRYYQMPVRRHTAASALTCRHVSQLPPVAIAYAYVGMEGGYVDVLVQSGAAGIVLAGFGHGRMAASVWRHVQAAIAKGIIIVRASRTLGGMITPLCEYPGTVSADTLTPQKAKILLQLALLQTRRTDEIQNLFQAY